jgi:hypothetical protein
VLVLLNVFLFWPQLLINDTTLSLAANLLKKRGIQFEWSEGHLSARSLSFWQKEISLSLHELTGVLDGIDLSANEFQITIGLAIDKIPRPLSSIGPIFITEGQINIHPSDSESAKSKTVAKTSKSQNQLPSPGSFIPAWVRATDFKGVAIEMTRIDVDLNGVVVRGSAKLSGQIDDRGTAWELIHDTDVIQGRESLASLKGSVDFRSLDTMWDGPYLGQLSERGTVLGEKTLALDLNATDAKNGKIGYTARASVDADKDIPLRFDVRGDYDKSVLSGVIDGTALRVIPELPKISTQSCRFKLSPATDPVQALHDFSLSCPITFTPKLPKLGQGLGPNVISKTQIVVDSHLRTAFPPSSDSPVKGTIDIMLDDLQSSLLQGKGGAKIELDGNLKKLPESLNAKSKIDLAIALPYFEKLVTALGRTRSWAVPEPLNSLTGPVDLEVKGEGNLPWDIRLLPIALKTRLKSATQRFSVDAGGSLAIETKKLAPSTSETTDISLNADVTLSDIKLALPRLDLAAPPRLIPDARIQIPKDKRETDSQSNVVFHHHIAIKTPKDHPVLLTSNLAKRNIPIDVDLIVADNQPSRIKLNISGFPINLFRRDAELEYFGLHTSEDGKRMVLNGRLRVAYTDYTIFINISGNTDAPKVDFTSDPHLNDQQVIAVLFFGKPIDQLEPGQMDSVESAKAALANSAVSLASMYILASTPIESVGYDPSSGKMTAKVHLTDGTSLNVGSDFKQFSTLGIRRRLGPNWAITTYLNNPFDTANRAFSALVEWNKRY